MPNLAIFNVNPKKRNIKIELPQASSHFDEREGSNGGVQAFCWMGNIKEGLIWIDTKYTCLNAHTRSVIINTYKVSHLPNKYIGCLKLWRTLNIKRTI